MGGNVGDSFRSVFFDPWHCPTMGLYWLFVVVCFGVGGWEGRGGGKRVSYCSTIHQKDRGLSEVVYISQWIGKQQFVGRTG